LFFPDIDFDTVRYFITEHALEVREEDPETGKQTVIGAFVKEDFN